MSAEDVFSRYASRVVLLRCDVSDDEVAQASGVLLSQDGFVVTNAHVVQGCRSMAATQISAGARRSYVALLKQYDEKRDTAVLKIESRGVDYFDLRPRPIRVGERVYAIGNPRGLEQSITEGIVSGIRADDDETSWIQHSAPISPGSSGGALVSARGEILGINSWSLKGSQGINFAVPIAAVADAYARARALQGIVRFPASSPAQARSEPHIVPPVDDVPPTPAPTAPSQPTSTDRLVRLSVTVSDTAGHRIGNLPQSAFAVAEDGFRQEIGSFAERGAPVSMGLVIDNSRGMWQRRDAVLSAASSLLGGLAPRDEAFIVNFAEDAFLDQDFTNDIRSLRDGLSRFTPQTGYSGGGNAMRDAVRMSIDHLKERAIKVKRVLVVVTDGDDNRSLISHENLVKSAQDSGVLIYAVGLLNREDRQSAKRYQRTLKALAEATDGQAFFPDGSFEAGRAAHLVMEDVDSAYAITYTAAHRDVDGSFHPISVFVSGPKHLVARTRSGYYAMPGAL